MVRLDLEMSIAAPDPHDRVVIDGDPPLDVVVRDGKNVKGRFLGVVLGSVGKGRLESAFENAVHAIEARNNGAATK